MRSAAYCVFFCLLFAAASIDTVALAQTAEAKNPLGVQMPAAPGPSQQGQEVGFFSKIWLQIRETQQSLHRDLAGAVKRIKGEAPLTAAIGLVILSFIYGVVHAVGPGHGKAVISSYVLANEQTVRRGIILAILASLLQAITAIALVLLLAALLNATGLEIKNTERHLESASYALVALVGAWLLYSVFCTVMTPSTSSHAHHHDHGHNHDHHDHNHDHHHSHDGPCETCGHNHLPDPKDLQGAWSMQKAAAIILAIGIRPCSGAVIVLVFALAQGLFWAGIASTFAMSVGTAITVSVLAVLAVGTKKAAVGFAGENSLWIDRVYIGMAFLGSTLVLVLGVVLFLSSLGPARPF